MIFSHGSSRIDIDDEGLPKLSVIVPFYNQYDFVEEAVESVLEQGYPNLEIILVDDGSDEGPLDSLAEMSDSIRFLRQENAGPSAARNYGIREATGEILAFLDSDDVWPEDKLKNQILPLLVDHGLVMVISQLKKLVSSDFDAGRFVNEGDSFYTIQLGCVLAKKEIFETVGMFDENLRYSEDQDWFLRARELEISMVRIACEGLHYRIHAASLTRRENRTRDFGLIQVLRRSLKRRKTSGGEAVRSLLSISDIPEWSEAR
tara:strand:- start:546 stop:1328 length:783 start_codon:yes stop_codon:yes gene_type:complete